MNKQLLTLKVRGLISSKLFGTVDRRRFLALITPPFTPVTACFPASVFIKTSSWFGGAFAIIKFKFASFRLMVAFPSFKNRLWSTNSLNENLTECFGESRRRIRSLEYFILFYFFETLHKKGLYKWINVSIPNQTLILQRNLYFHSLEFLQAKNTIHTITRKVCSLTWIHFDPRLVLSVCK